jgi:quercetin dioxygenase-like cupin family protein
MTRKRTVLALTFVLAGTTFAAVALATPGSGVLSGIVMARAGFVDHVSVKFAVKDSFRGTEVIAVNGAQETVVQQIVLAPNGNTGWHSHPGPVVVLIKSGELTFYSGDDPACTPRTYTAGQAFIDAGQGHVHFARNLSATQNTELWATYFDVPPGAGFRIDAPAPGNCTF